MNSGRLPDAVNTCQFCGFGVIAPQSVLLYWTIGLLDPWTLDHFLDYFLDHFSDHFTTGEGWVGARSASACG